MIYPTINNLTSLSRTPTVRMSMAKNPLPITLKVVPPLDRKKSCFTHKIKLCFHAGIKQRYELIEL